MKLGARRAISFGRMALLVGGFVLLLLAVVRVNAAPGSSAAAVVTTSVQSAVVSGVLAVSGVSGSASEVDIPRRPHPRTPVRPPGPPDTPPKGIPPWHPHK